MSGASLPASINSPVLRRAGGKPALLEQDLAETSEGEGLPLSVEMLDLKSGNVLIHGAAITPSPILLWRLKGHRQPIEQNQETLSLVSRIREMMMSPKPTGCCSTLESQLHKNLHD